jgi:hypothetical protein
MYEFFVTVTLHKIGCWSTRIEEPIIKAKISVHNTSSMGSNKTAPYKKIIGICTKLYLAMSENYYKTEVTTATMN